MASASDAVHPPPAPLDIPHAVPKPEVISADADPNQDAKLVAALQTSVGALTPSVPSPDLGAAPAHAPDSTTIRALQSVPTSSRDLPLSPAAGTVPVPAPAVEASLTASPATTSLSALLRRVLALPSSEATSAAPSVTHEYYRFAEPGADDVWAVLDENGVDEAKLMEHLSLMIGTWDPVAQDDVALSRGIIMQPSARPQLVKDLHHALSTATFTIPNAILPVQFIPEAVVVSHWTNNVRGHLAANSRHKITSIRRTFGSSWAEGKCYGMRGAFPFHIIMDIAAVQRDADANEPAAQYELGRRFWFGYGLEKDQAKSFQWCRKAAEQGHTHAMIFIASSLRDGAGVATNVEEGQEWLVRALSQGNPVAARQLGTALQNGEYGCIPNLKKAAEYYRDAIRLGDVPAIFHLGSVYKRDPQKELRYFARAASLGNSQAQFLVGLRYLQGDGVKRDLKLAALWLEKAAKQDRAEAMTALSITCLRRPEDYQIGMKLLVRAMELEEPKAHSMLAELFAEGKCGVPKDPALAAKIATAGANLGDEASMGLCGFFLLRGIGVTQHLEEGLKWVKRGAEHKDPLSMGELARCLEDGIGGPQNPELACNLYREAAKAGDPASQYWCGQQLASLDKHGKALEWFEKAAKRGYLAAVTRLGMCYLSGRGVLKDEKASVGFFKIAAEGGDPVAQCNLGICYYRGRGIELNYEEAFKWFQRSADQDEGSAFTELGVCYYNGRGVAKDRTKAIEHFQKAAKRGFFRAMQSLGELYMKGEEGVEGSPQLAAHWYMQAARAGATPSQVSIGMCLMAGLGIEMDKEAAVEWFYKAAEQGDLEAQYQLGAAYEHGEGVPKDKMRALNWYTKAADEGHPEAQFAVGLYCDLESKELPRAILYYSKAATQGNIGAILALGNCCRLGRGVAKDEKRAFGYILRGAELGDKLAQSNVAQCFLRGVGCTKSEEDAVKWYTKAAAQGHAPSQYQLSLCYEGGVGVAKDAEQAEHWRQEALKNGYSSETAAVK